MLGNGWASLKERLLESKVFRSFMIYSAFRAVYGAGILVVTYLLATSDQAPIWVSGLFLLASMAISRAIFRAIKRRWPHLA
ncbi:MAG: hypothetical protein QF911_05025 [Candidatus Thalassarchaeaceae archaeon]|jgi:hypothetical protein|nr:hypothetical protein [Candidatus Thalassarchaeaceae archaeon]